MMTRETTWRAAKLCAWLLLAALTPSVAQAQTVPVIDRTPCTECAPAGWTVIEPSPDFVTGNGPWPGGTWFVNNVSGVSPQGGGMTLSLSNETVRERIGSTITGLTAGRSYRACFYYESMLLNGGGGTYEGGGFTITVQGVPTTFPEAANWTLACAQFVAAGTTAPIVLGISDGGRGTFGGGIVIDGGGPSAIVPVCTLDAQCGGATPFCNVGTGACVACNTAAQCNDNVACTTDACVANACVNTTAPAGSPCAGGVCDGQAAPTCQVCINDTVAGQDAGCSAATPACTIRGATRVCVQCEADAGCPATQLCNPAGACEAAFVDINAPADGQNTNDNTPTLAGNANAGEAVSVSVTANGSGVVVFSATTPATGGSWSVDASTLPDGLYTVAATVSASGGQRGDTASFRVDTTPPVVTVTAPTSGLATNDDTPTLSGTAADTGAGVTSLTVEVVDAMGMVVSSSTPTVAAGGTWSVDVSTLPDGAYTVRATALDGAGNSVIITPVPFTVDTTAPAITLDVPADDAQLNDATPTISGTAEVGATLAVVVRDAAGMIVFTGAPVVAMNGAWSVDATTLPDGAYTAQASATDAAGNAASSAAVSFIVDTTAPVVTIISPANQAAIADSTPEIVGSTEPGATVVVELLDDAGAVLETFTVTADNMGAWTTAAVMELADGDYTIRATATDLASNTGVAATSTFTVDATALPIAITAPTAGAQATAAPAITGTTAPGAIVTVEIKDAAGAIVETLTVTADNMGGWTAQPVAAMADGTYAVSASVSNSAGVISSASTTYAIDTAAPAVAISTPAEGAVLSSSPATITGTAEAGALVTVELTGAGGMVVETLTATADAMGMWSVTPAALADGAYTINAEASDAAGNTATAGPRAFEVDATAPTVAITAPTAGQQVTDTTPTITGTAAPGAVVTILIDGAQAGTATADANGMWSFDAAELAPGAHTVEATTTDGAGNMGSSGSISFEVGAIAPVVIVTPVTGGTVTGPAVTVTGTGEPGATITVKVGDQTQTAVVGQDGTWTVTFNEVPAGMTTIEAGDGMSTTSINITVDEQTVAPEDDLVLTGGCAQGAGGPAHSALWLIALGGLAVIRRRKRA
jgi:MYXO-CTERM domain-containing protein